MILLRIKFITFHNKIINLDSILSIVKLLKNLKFLKKFLNNQEHLFMIRMKNHFYLEFKIEFKFTKIINFLINKRLLSKLLMNV